MKNENDSGDIELFDTSITRTTRYMYMYTTRVKYGCCGRTIRG